jgi:hypothetical protein
MPHLNPPAILAASTFFAPDDERTTPEGFPWLWNVSFGFTTSVIAEQGVAAE